MRGERPRAGEAGESAAVVAAQGTIAAVVETQNQATLQAQGAMRGATGEANRMATDLEQIVGEG